MKIRILFAQAAALALASFYASTSGAVPVLCEDASLNHMYVDSAYVSGCLAGGTGNINGNPGTDAFLLGGGNAMGLVGVEGGSFTQTNEFGTFSLDASLWDAYSSLAIGFKFGTGNKPDEWFVYSLNALVTLKNNGLHSKVTPVVGLNLGL